MLIPYQTKLLSPAVRNEIHYYLSLCILKRMQSGGIIDETERKNATVALAEKYRVSRYDI